MNAILSDEMPTRPKMIEFDKDIDYSAPKFVEILSDLAETESIIFEQNVAFICESFAFYDFDPLDIYTEANISNLLRDFIQANNALITNVDETEANNYVETSKNESDGNSKLFKSFLETLNTVTTASEANIVSILDKLKLAKENKIQATSSDDLRIMNSAISRLTKSLNAEITLIQNQNIYA